MGWGGRGEGVAHEAPGRGCMAKALRPSCAAPTPPGAPSSRPWCLAWPVTASRCHCQPAAPPAQDKLGQGVGRLRVDVPHPRLQGGAELSRVVLEARASPRFWGRGGEGADASWPRPGASGLRGGETLPQARVRSACGTHSRLRLGRRPFPLQRFSSSFPKLRATGPTTSAGC